ncbi:MAG: PAS domain S-box protein [Candidatus Reddybacter sp.]
MTDTIETTENTYQSILEAMQTFVVITETDGTVHFANKTPLKIAGLELEDVLEKKLWDCFWFNFNPETQAHVQDCVRLATTGENIHEVIQVRIAAGLLWIDFKIQPVIENGKVIRLVAEGSDITEQEHLREDNQLAQQRLQGLFDDMQSMVAILDIEGRIELVNNTPLLISGIDQEDVLGEPLWSAIWFQGDDKTQTLLQQNIQSAAAGEAARCDVQCQTSDGLIWLEFNVHPVFDDKGNVSQLVAEGGDPRARREVEIEREQVLLELEEREKNLAITLDSISDAVITTDANGLVTRMNPIAEQLTGWSFDEAQQQPLSTIFPIFNASTGEHLGSPVDRVMATNEIVHLSNNTTLRSRDGSEYQIADSAAPIRDKNKQILGGILVFSDVTEQYRLREQAKASQQQLQRLFNDMQTMVGLYEPDGTTTFLNNTPLLASGFTMAETIGKKLWETPFFNYSDESITQVREYMHDAAMGASTLVDHQIMTRQGDKIWVALNFHPVFDDNGLVIQLVGEARDITERKTIENELRSSAQQLKRYRDQAPLATIEMDINQKVVGWNDAAEKMFGYTSVEAKGQLFTFILPDDFNRTESPLNLKDLANIRADASVTSEFRRKDGSLFFGQCHHAPFIGESGEVIGAGSIIRDITTERTAQLATLDSERARKEILDSIVEAIIVTDETGNISAVNVTAEKLLGYGNNELIGEHVATLVEGQDEESILKNMQIYFQTGNIAQIGMGLEIKVICKNGDTFPTTLAVAELSPTEDGKRRFINSFRDLTETKQQEEQLRRSQKMDALGKLTGGIAHDFNNMLGIVTGYADLLESALSNNEKLAQYANEIHRAGERGANLTRKLLSFSQHAAVSAQSLDINELINNQQHMLKTSLTPRIQLVFELSDDIWPTCLDRDDLEDAIINMCINAMHAIQANGRVTIRTENIHLHPANAQQKNLPSGDYVLLSITDTGKGIEEATKQRIFDPFYTTKGEQGTGLGLSQVYGFVERSKGAIEVSSILGQGTQLRIYFPRDITKANIEDVENSANKKTSSGDETILVVDDEAILLRLCTEILSQQGYKVLPAGSCSEALQLLDANHVDLLFSDVVMPDMDGYELAMIVAEKYPTIKIQMTSGFTDDRQDAMRDNSLHFNLLLKPYRAQTLVTKIRVLLDEQ